MARFRTPKMFDEKITLSSSAICSASGTMASTWYENEVKIFVCFDEGIRYLHRRRGIYVPIEFAHDEH